MGGEDVRMSWLRNSVPLGVALGAILVHPPPAWALPNPGPLRFIGSTPADGAMVTTGTVGVAVDASCTFAPNRLPATLNGTTIPASAFRPFSACSGGRITSQTVMVAVTLPSATIGSAPTSLNPGQAGNFSGSGTGDGLLWNFDGGAGPAPRAPAAAPL